MESSSFSSDSDSYSKQSGSASKKNFFNYVFSFNDDSKAEMLNIVQYSLLAIIPIVILNKLSQKYVPEANEEKSSLEILAEIVVQVLVIFFGIYFINRMIVYVPTYSGEKYPEFSTIYIVLAVLLITMSLQTKLGEKVSILVDRVSELWEGKTEPPAKNSKKGGNKKREGMTSSNQSQTQYPSESSAMTQSLYGGQSSMGAQDSQSTMISQLPTYASSSSSGGASSSMPSSSMGMDNFGPVAANEGGSAFGSAFG